MARFWIIAYSVASVSGNAVKGALIVTTTVVASGSLHVGDRGPEDRVLPGPALSPVASRNALKLSAIACASSGAPDWNVRPSRIVNVQVSRSSETSQESTSAGW